MKTIDRFFILLVALTPWFYSCNPVLYSNVGQNVPMFQNKDELVLNTGYALTTGGPFSDADGVQVQAAYAVTDKLAGMASFYSMKGIEDPDADEWKGKGSYFEAGFGTYGANSSKMILYEVFGGLGTGSIQNTSLINPGDNIDVKFLKPFIQPSVGFTSKYFEVVLTPRLAYLTYTSNSYHFTEPGKDGVAEAFFTENDNKVVFEPGVTLRGGLSGAKLQLQYVYSTFEPNFEEIETVNNGFFSLSLYLLISNRFK